MESQRGRINTLSTTFARSAVLYLVGQVLNAAIPLFLLPILTRYLSPTDYGIVATSTVLIQVFNVILSMNSQGLIGRTFFDGDRLVLTRLVSTNVLGAAASGLVLLLVLSVLGSNVEEVTKFPSIWMPMLVLISFCSVVQTVYLSLIQARREPKVFVTIQLGSTLLNLSLSLLLVVVVGMDWRGRMLAILGASTIIGFLSFFGLSQRLKFFTWRFELSAFRDILSFGIPLIPHFVGGWVMTMVARIYLNNMASIGDTGLFSVAYNVASPVALVVGAANQAYWPALFEKLSNDIALNKLQLCRLLLLAAVLLPIFGILFGLAAIVILPLLVGHRFYGASNYVLWLVLAFAIQGVYFIFGNFVVFSKRTSLLSWRADFLGGIVMLVACPILIRLFGPIGAAQATAMAFAVSCVGCITASRIAYPMPWRKAIQSFLAISNRDRERSNDAVSSERGGVQ